MTITASDIKLLASERMTDTSDGGGRRTSNVIPDGVPGNIFPKVSRLDSVYGRVNLRKVFGAVDTANVDTYAGAHAVVMDAPDNDRIHVNLFSTGSEFDDRTDARDRIESYVIAGPESAMILYGRQLVSQQAILAYQGVAEPLPEVDEIFCLSKEVGGVVIQQQYVRVTDIEFVDRTLEDAKGTFVRRIVTLKIGSPLRYEFRGPDTPDRLSSVARETLIRRTSVADAARYFGIKPVSEAATAGDLQIKVSTVYSPIVPTTQRETPLSNVEIQGAAGFAGGAAAPVAMASWGPQTIGDGVHELRLPTPAKAGSVEFTATGLSFLTIWTDNGDGTLTLTGGNISGALGDTLNIDYETGIIDYIRTTRSADVWSFDIAYIPAAEVTQAAHTRSIDITLSTRGTVYVETLKPVPAPGTLAVDFRALGKWYRLKDDGTGALRGDDTAFGAGTIDYTSGALVVTLGALPDVGSRVLMSWASGVHYTLASGASADAGATVQQRIQLDHLPVKPSTVVVTYTAGVTVYTGTETAGVITGGNITGTVNHATGEVVIEFASKLPNVGTATHVAYTQEVPTTADPTSIAGTVTVTDPSTTFNLGVTNIALKGLTLTIPVAFSYYGATNIGSVLAADDGAGNLVTLGQNVTIRDYTLFVTGGLTIGTVDYSTGDVTITSGSLASTFNTYPSNSPLTVPAQTWQPATTVPGAWP
jgi:hypothetical protein